MIAMKKYYLYLFLLPLLALGLGACEETDDGEDDGFVEVPNADDEDAWVTDSDIRTDDLEMLVDLSAKTEAMRLQFIKMLSNNFEGDRLFSGVGANTDVEPTIDCITALLEKSDEYEEAIDRLEKTAVLTPTTRGKLKNIYNILFTGRNEAKEEQEKVQDNLNKIKAFSNAKAQQQLYDFFVDQEPKIAKKIGASDAKEFFQRLNNGELNNYIFKISHVWRDKGILMADQSDNAVGDYAYVSFTGSIEYGKAAYRVASKVAVAYGELYFTAIDQYAGGYGAKIMEIGDAIKDKLTALTLAAKLLKGKPDWQGMNTYIVNQISGDIKKAISDAIGEDPDFTDDLINMVTEEICDYIVQQCTVEDEQKQDEAAEDAGTSVLTVETDAGSAGKMVLITDDKTGKVSVAIPNADGKVSVPTTTGSKTITVINGRGERITKKVNAEEGETSVNARKVREPYLTLNPDDMTLDPEGETETAAVLTNCKYVKCHLVKDDGWCDAVVEQTGSGQLRSVRLIVTAEANPDQKERAAIVVVDGYKDKDKVAATARLIVTQKANGTIIATPDELTFDANGGMQKVTLDVGNYEYYGGRPADYCDDWLSVKISEEFIGIEVTAKPNPTKKERSGMVYVYGTNVSKPTNDDLDQVAIVVTQKGNSLIVTPTELSFTAYADKQSVTIESTEYAYFGAEVSKEGNGWATVTTEKVGNKTYATVNVTYNNTGKERECEVICWGSNVQNPTDKDKTTFPVKVTQQTDESYTYTSVTMYINLYSKEGHKISTYNEGCSDQVTQSGDGKTTHITATGEYNGRKKSCSFTINHENGWAGSVINDFTFKYDSGIIDWYTYTEHREWTVTASNIPFIGDGRWSGKVNEGASILFSSSGTVYRDGKETHSSSTSDSPYDDITITLYGTVNGRQVTRSFNVPMQQQYPTAQVRR